MWFKYLILVGLNINGYVDGKPYYGNVYYVNGIRYAGTSANSGTNIVVYDTQLASVQKRQIEGAIAPSQIEETETQRGYYRSYKFSIKRKLLYHTNKCSINSHPATQYNNLQHLQLVVVIQPHQHQHHHNTSTTSTPSTPSTPSGGGGGGYGGGY